MRLFIASPVQLDHYDTLKADFSTSIVGKWPIEKNLHLTWVFLGETMQADEIVQKLRSIPPPISPVPLVSLALFTRRRSILYAEVNRSALKETVHTLQSAGFAMQRFTPHITLCRIKKVTDRRKLERSIEYYRGEELGVLLPTIHLYRSTLTPDGPIYERLD
jgi:2'-5' RNA ligase